MRITLNWIALSASVGCMYAVIWRSLGGFFLAIGIALIMLGLRYWLDDYRKQHATH